MSLLWSFLINCTQIFYQDDAPLALWFRQDSLRRYFENFYSQTPFTNRFTSTLPALDKITATRSPS